MVARIGDDQPAPVEHDSCGLKKREKMLAPSVRPGGSPGEARQVRHAPGSRVKRMIRLFALSVTQWMLLVSTATP